MLLSWFQCQMRPDTKSSLFIHACPGTEIYGDLVFNSVLSALLSGVHFK